MRTLTAALLLLPALAAADTYPRQLAIDAVHYVFRLAPDAAEADADGGPSPWFVRVTFPGIPPPDPFIVAVATAAGFRVQWLAQGPRPFARVSSARGGAVTLPSRWLLVAPQSRDAVSSAAARLLATHRIHAVPFRKIEDR